jgi:hypothetical protein
MRVMDIIRTAHPLNTLSVTTLPHLSMMTLMILHPSSYASIRINKRNQVRRQGEVKERKERKGERRGIIEK